MNLRLYMTIIVSCVCSFVLHAQETYLWLGVHGNDVGFPYEYHMYNYDIHTGDAELIFTIDSSQLYHDDLNGAIMRIESFEFSPDRQSIFLLESEGDLYSYDLASGMVTYLQDITPENTDFFWYGYTNTTNITQLDDSLYYISGNTLGVYNANTGLYDKLSQPPDLFTGQTDVQWDWKTHRKVVSHKGRWITIDGEVYLRYINPSDPEDSERALDVHLVPLGHSKFPLISYTYDCDSTVLYIFDKRSHTFASDSVEIDRVDLEAGTVTRAYSHLGLFPDGAPFYSLFEVKHYNAITWEDCQRKIDLDRDDSTIGVLDFLLDSLCQVSPLPLSDTDIVIANEYPVDSVVIEVVVGEASVTLPAGNYATTASDGKVVIANNGSTTNTEIETAIRNGTLTTTNQESEINLRYTVWYAGQAGLPATAILRLASPLPMAGDDVERAYCEGDLALSLANILPPNADSGGTFYDQNYSPISVLPPYTAPDSDTLYYITTNGICYDTAQIINTINPTPTIVAVPDTVLCAGEQIEIALAFYSEALQWSDGETDKTRVIAAADIYVYELENTCGCTARDTFEVAYLPPAQVKPIDAQVCEGESFEFRSQVYEEPGVYTDTLYSSAGCDSIIYDITFSYHPTEGILLSGDLDICEGEQAELTVTSGHTDLLLNGTEVSAQIAIAEEGLYTLSGYDANGCYHEAEFEIVVYVNPTIIISDLIDTVYSQELSIPVSYDGDGLTYLWSPAAGLDCGDCAVPFVVSDADASYSVTVYDDNGCSAEASMQLSFKKSEIYLPTVIANRPTIPENGVLYLQGNSSLTYDIQVYDRWGNLVYNAQSIKVNDSSAGWRPNGDYTAGVYVYKVVYQENGEAKVLVGDVTVL